MNKAITEATYRKRILNVVSYIYEHLMETLSVERLADVACFSPYHFHRIYREIVGESVHQTVKRLRLQRGAYELMYTEKAISDIAIQIGYGSKEAFSRAFSQSFEMSPSQFRQVKQQALKDPLTLPQKKDYNMSYSVEFEDVPQLNLAGLEHIGDYMEIGSAFEQVGIKGGAAGVFSANTRSIGIYYNSPTEKDKSELRAHACITASPEQAKAMALEPLSVGPYKCAALTFKGPYAELEKVYEWFYGEWLQNSGFEPEHAPAFEEYLNNPQDTPPSELLTKIYLPIKAS